MGFRLNAAQQLLDSYSTLISVDVTRASRPTARITAGESELSSGSRITDVNLYKLQDALDADRLFLNSYFNVNIGHRVVSQDEVITCVVEEFPEATRSEISNSLAEAIKTAEIHMLFGFDYFSEEYELIYNYITELEQQSKLSIDHRNISRLNRCIYYYQSLFYSLSLSSVGESAELQQRIVHPVLASLASLFEYTVRNRPPQSDPIVRNQKPVHTQQLQDLIDQTFLMGRTQQDNDFTQFTFMSEDDYAELAPYFEELLEHYAQEAKEHFPELVDDILSRLTELRESSMD
jgi:hypothetical protein